MKGRICFFIALFIFAGTITRAQKLDVGLKAGADIHKLNGMAFDDGFAFGYHVGAFVKVGITKKLSIQPEVQWSQVNIDTSSDFSDIYQFSNITQVKLGYLRVPILLDYRILPKLSLQAGPQFGVLIDHNLSVLQNGQDAFKKGDFSMLGGIQLSLLNFRIYGRYAIGLNNINGIDNRDQWKNQSIQLGLGVAF